jgi:hypothetical protein
MTIPTTVDGELDTLLIRAYPELTEAELQDVRLDLGLIARWLLEQVELGNPALETLPKKSDECLS